MDRNERLRRISDLAFSVYEALKKASSSVDVLAGSASVFSSDSFRSSVRIEEIPPPVDRRLRLRRLVSGHRNYVQSEFDKLLALGWEVRLLHKPPKFSCVIIDGLSLPTGRRRAYISDDSELDNLVTRIRFGGTGSIQRHFEHLWMSAEAEPGTRIILYEDLGRSSIAAVEREIVVASQDRWGEVISELARDPGRLYGLSARQFEELVAELLNREGYTVHLTRQTKDGGKDALVLAETPVGEQLYLVECKRYARRRRVGVSWVRELYGVVRQEQATAGLLVTTSYFTDAALAFREPVKWQLSLKDFDATAEWIRQCAEYRRT